MKKDLLNMDTVDLMRSYLASGLDALPYAEVADDPGHRQTDNQVCVQRANLIDP